MGLFIPHAKEMEPTFVDTGYGPDWKNALAAFEKHEGLCHEEATAACAALLQDGISTRINKQNKDLQRKALVALGSVISSIIRW